MELIDKQVAIDAIGRDPMGGLNYRRILSEMPTAEPKIVRCKDCLWWDRIDDASHVGYCHAIKHGYYSTKWEIQIYRKYREDFFCADGERREDG